MPAKRLPWIKFWPEAVDHAKVAQLGDGEFRTWITVLARAAQQPVRWHFASRRHAAVVTGRPLAHINTLVNFHLLDDQDGIWVHDWRQWQDRYASDFDESPNPDPTPDEHQRNGASKTAVMVRESSANTPPTLRESSPEHSTSSYIQKGEERRETLDVERTPDGVPAKSPEKTADDESIDAVYGHFRTRIQPRSRLCPRKKIAARLKHFTVDELKLGIDHFADDPWWMEHNATQGAEWFFESDRRSEQFLLMQPRPASNVVPMGRRPIEPPRHVVDNTGVAN